MLKKIARKLHLWLGLFSAIPVCIVCLTGSVYVFKNEIEDIAEPWRFTKTISGPAIRPSEAIGIVNRSLPDYTVIALTYGESTDALRMDCSRKENDFVSVWLNPSTGEIQKIVHPGDDSSGFFRFILDGHRRLWLPVEIGRPVLGCCVLLFAAALLTGIILWWPKIWSRTAVSRLFKIKWDAGKRRLTFDLHNVIGFYFAFILLIMAGTGLVWSFRWYSEGLYKLTGGKELKAYKLPNSNPPLFPSSDIFPVDELYNRLRKAEPEAKEFYIVIPREKTDACRVSIVHKRDSYYCTDNLFFDRYTLIELEGEGPYAGRYRETSTPDRIRRMNLEIHDGRIAGLPGKILVFLAGLVGASLPITGWMMWWRKRSVR
jgi:uncharacterized iron-regulated membrane protein